MAHTIQLRGGSSALATSTNPVLHAREIGVETGTWQFKIGDGVTAWNSLPYGGLVGPSGGPVPVGGTAGQIIVKDSATDFDVSWRTGVISTAATSFPSSPVFAEECYRTDLDEWYKYNGTVWTQL